MSLKKFETCVEKLLSTGIVPASGDFIALSHGDKVLISKPSADLNALGETDLLSFDKTQSPAEVTAKTDALCGAVFALFAGKKGIGAAIVSHPEYAAAVANMGKDMPPVLDDMAQIVGPSLRFAKNPSVVKSKLKGRCCLLLAGGGLLATARTSTEAVTATLVAEKSCRVFIKAATLGGAVSISKLDAWIMHLVYTLKYSKKNIENQKEDE